MHDQLVVHEVEAIRLGGLWIVDHLLTQLGTNGRKVVDVFAGIRAVRDAESKVKVERLQQGIVEKVPFNHSETVDCLGPDLKLDTGMEEGCGWTTIVSGVVELT